jgi:hypothetical protein
MSEAETASKPKRTYKRKPKEEKQNTEQQPEKQPESVLDSTPEVEISSVSASANNEVIQLNPNYWKPSFEIVDFLAKSLKAKHPVLSQVVEMTNVPQHDMFALTTQKLEWYNTVPAMIKPGTDYVFVRHALEKLHNPQEFLEHLKLHVPRGYIETASPFVEMARQIYRGAPYRGHLHNRYLIWSSEDHTLHILPKTVMMEVLELEDDFENDIYKTLSQVPYYWNSYYTWDEEHPLKWVYYQHGVNMDMDKDYPKLIQKAFEENLPSTNNFLIYINENMNVYKDKKPVNDSVSASTSK